MTDTPLPLEQTDPGLAEAFRLIANGIHPTIQTVSQCGPYIILRYKDGRWVTRKMKEPGRNDQCPCGSGKKFKRCCRPA